MLTIAEGVEPIAAQVERQLVRDPIATDDLEQRDADDEAGAKGATGRDRAAPLSVTC